MLTPDVGRLDRRIAQEASTLAAHGWSVDIYSAVDAHLEFDDRLAPGVRLICRPAVRRVYGPIIPQVRRLKRAVGQVVPAVNRVVERTRYRMTDPASEIANLDQEVRSTLGRYDLVFAHDIPVFRLGAALRRAWGVALICDLHEIYPEQDEFLLTGASRRYWVEMESEAAHQSDGIICVNAAVADYIVRMYQPTAPIAVVHNSVPFVERSQLVGPNLRGIYPVPAGLKIMLFAGSIRPNKGLETLIEGFAEAALKGWALAVIGEGPLLGQLQQIVARRRLSGSVFVGQRVAQEHLIAVAASADVGLLPYQGAGLNYQVATPNKLFEYAAARLPIASSHLPEISRLISDLGNGGFVDFSTPTTTALGLRRFVEVDLNGITTHTLERAAERLAWGRDELNLLSTVAQVSEAQEHRTVASQTGVDAGSVSES